MRFQYFRYAKEYGTREEPTIVTNSQYDILFSNHSASLKSVFQMNTDFLKKALSPASKQKLARGLRGKKPVFFTQSFGNGYKETFRVKVEKEKSLLVFTFYELHKYSSELPLSASVAESNMNSALQNLLNATTMVEYMETSSISPKELAQTCRKATMNTIRCVRQQQYLHKPMNCYAFHLPTLLNLLMEPCSDYLKNTPFQVHFSKFSGEKNIKCDADIFRYLLYSLISTTIYHTGKDASLRYSEYADFVRIDIHSDKEYPIIIQNTKADSKALCDALGITTAAFLVEKLQGELSVHAMEEQLLLSLSFPAVTVEGAFKELAHTKLQESISSLEVEFSIL